MDAPGRPGIHRLLLEVSSEWLIFVPVKDILAIYAEAWADTCALDEAAAKGFNMDTP